MHEICGDITLDNKLSKREKFSYFVHNALRAVTAWSVPGKVRGWKGRIEPNGSDSPGRIYVDSYLRQELPKLVLPGKIRVLDIGCGTGYVQTTLAELGYTGEYVGLDITREAGFKAHTEAFEVSFVESPIEQFVSNTPFDLVLSNTAFEHIENDRKAGHVAGRVLVPGGAGVHIVPSYWSLFLYLWHGYRQYTPKMLRHVFGGQNYTITGLGGLGSFLLHLFCITFPERVFGSRSFRSGNLYPKLVSVASSVDRLVPVCRALSAVVVRSRKDVRTKVLFALPSLLVGGIEQQLTEQLKRYDRTRFTLGLLTLFEYEGRESFKDKLPPDVHFESIGMRGAFDWGGWARLISFLRQFSPDVVVSSMFSANTALRVLKSFFRYQVIAREHNIYDEKKFWQRLTDRVLAGVTCCIIAVSKSVATFASKQAGIRRNKFVVIQNGVDIEKLQHWHKAHGDNASGSLTRGKETLKQELGFKKDEHIILTVGRLKKTKNHEALIKGFVSFSKEHPKHRLVIIGSGAEQPRLQELVREAGDSVLLLERYGEAVWPYYAVSDWFILPSLREGFPNVLLEAMAFGLPLLATDISGSNECVADTVNGFLVPSSASGITGSLRRAAKLSEQEVDAMGRASLEHVKRFTIDETVRKYEECFTSCHSKN